MHKLVYHSRDWASKHALARNNQAVQCNPGEALVTPESTTVISTKIIYKLFLRTYKIYQGVPALYYQRDTQDKGVSVRIGDLKLRRLNDNCQTQSRLLLLRDSIQKKIIKCQHTHKKYLIVRPIRLILILREKFDKNVFAET